VSVIIPAYNYGRFIGATLRSVQAQTLEAWEVLVVDDGSTDDTAQIVSAVSAADPRIRCVTQANSGLSAGRNRGLRETSAPLVQFLDADDLIGPDKLRHQARLLDSLVKVDLVYGVTRYFRDGENAQSASWERELAKVTASGEELVAALIENNIMAVQAPLIRRSLLGRVGEFDTSLRALEDWDFWIRCALSGATFLFDDSGGPACSSYVRLHDSSMTNKREGMLRIEIDARRRYHAELPEALRRRNLHRIRETEADIGVREALSGRPRQGALKLLRSGCSERRLRWLVLGVLAPGLGSAPGRRALESWRRLKTRWRLTKGSPE
jgi:GT2 family glycosyltransferase